MKNLIAYFKNHIIKIIEFILIFAWFFLFWFNVKYGCNMPLLYLIFISIYIPIYKYYFHIANISLAGGEVAINIFACYLPIVLFIIRVIFPKLMNILAFLY